MVVRYPDIPCLSLGRLSFHLYPNKIMDNGNKSEQIDKNINITFASFQILSSSLSLYIQMPFLQDDFKIHPM